MFYRYRWLEVLYLFSGHVVLVGSLMIFAYHGSGLEFQQWQKLLFALDTKLLWFGSILGMFILGVLLFAVLCSLAPLLYCFRRYEAAIGLYRFTRMLRTRVPVFGKSARTAVWDISLANCYRELGRNAESEELYKLAIDHCRNAGVLDRWTHYGLKSVALENYAALLRKEQRYSEAQQVESSVDASLAVLRLKYVLVSAIVLIVGAGFMVLENMQLSALKLALFGG